MTRARYGPLLAYVLIIIVTVVGFVQFEKRSQEAERQQAELCRITDKNREALRQVYKDVAELADQLSQLSNDPQRREALLARIDAFKKDRLDALPPTQECSQ